MKSRSTPPSTSTAESADSTSSTSLSPKLPFVFGNLNDTFANLFAGKGPDVEKLSGQMMDAWLAFARTGDPSHAGIGTW